MNTPTNQVQLELPIRGMGCEACVSRVREALEGVDTVELDAVTLDGASLRYDPGSTDPDAIRAAVRQAGYEPVESGG